MFNDFFTIFYWWLIVSGLGVVFTPLTFKLFPKFFDRGYAFSKIIGILIVSYVVWLLGSLKILQFVPEAVWLVVVGMIALNLFFLREREKRESFAKDAKKILKIIIFEEVLFFAALAFWAFVRGFQPDIHGAEKFMDFSFLNSLLRSPYFPPKDTWFAGGTINYYYFGHLMTAVLTKLSALDSAVTYNLMIATVFALTFTTTFSLAGNLMYANFKNFKFRASNLEFRILATGLLSAFLLTLGGNLHTLYWFIKNRNFRAYWYYDAIRFIGQQFGAADNTINEFPACSFVIGDLHSHLLNIPTVLLILALLLNLKTEGGRQKTDPEDRRQRAEKSVFSPLFSNIRSQSSVLCPLVFLALCFATTFMTNAWDFPIYFLVTGLVVWWKEGLKRAAAFCSLVFLFSCLLSLPFHLNFQNITQGIALTDFHSPPWMLLVLWGFPLFLTVTFFIFRRGVAAEFYSAPKGGSTKCCSYITTLLAVGWLLILIPEIIYVKDIYINSFQRANTMFKLTYQSFIMFSLAGGYLIVQTLSHLKKKLPHFLYAVALFTLLIFVFIYPFHAVRSNYGLKRYQGLGGLKWFKEQYPDDFEAVNWLKENIKGQPVILEAVGESYTDFARVSANTGLPTVVGWTVHEWLWRGGYDEPGKRAEEVRKIYESAEAKDAKNLLTKYKIEYIFVGELERQKYAELNEEKLAKIGEVVFKNEGAKIYHLTPLEVF